MASNQNAITTQAASSFSYSRRVDIVLWVVQGLLALIFVGAGVAKLLGNAYMVAIFEAIGIGQWFRYVTGIFEVTGALLIVLSKTRVLGAGLLAGVMIGATVAHLFVLHSSPVAALVLLALAGVVLWGRRRELMLFLNR